jgi:hypothetical protein
MPSTVPGSGLESSDICIWCRTGYPNYRPKGESKLREMLAADRNRAGADCLVGISGGKDSAYAALELATTYGLRVEAFTYVHDGLAPEAERNADAVCRILGIEHHLVSLVNHEHLNSFRAYFKTWAKSPGLLSAAMTCVACKHLHLLGTELAARRGIPMVIWANCPLENPPFLALRQKSPNGGANEFKRENIATAAARLAGQVPALAGALIRYPRTSMLGCLAVTPRSKYLGLRFPSVKQVFFYDFIDWNPAEIVNRLQTEAGWVKPNAPDDWHSDCRFNIFKEYMFQSMFGASYTDAFLSNQVRYGLISRNEAWRKLKTSKAYYASQIPGALAAVGLKAMAGQLDLTCFDVGE